MDLVLVQKAGVDLYTTLSSSETSRRLLRFYPPKKRNYGVSITCSTLGSALSLATELNWYIRRYTHTVFLEIGGDRRCTLGYGQDVYERFGPKHPETWAFRKLLAIGEDACVDEEVMEPGTAPEQYPEVCAHADEVLVVWCTEREMAEFRLMPDNNEDDTIDSDESEQTIETEE
jgi:hypothetical protein